MMTALIAAGTFTGNMVAHAQSASNTPPPAAQPPGGARMGAANLEHIATQLGLTDEQKEKVRPIFTDRMHQIMDLHKDSSMDRAAKMAKFKEIVDETNNKLKEVLTADQYAKWLSMSMVNRRPPGGTMAPAPGGASAPAPGSATAPAGGNKPQQ